MTPNPDGIKVAKVLLVGKEILGVHVMVVEEDVVLVVEGRKKQTLWLRGITTKNLSDRFSMHSPEFSFSVEQFTGQERQKP